MTKVEVLKLLTKQELKVFELLITDKTYQEIAAEVGVTKRTVFFSTRSICSKIGARDRTALMSKFISYDDKVDMRDVILDINSRMTMLESYLKNLLPPGGKLGGN